MRRGACPEGRKIIPALECRDQPPAGVAIGHPEQLLGNPSIVFLVEQQLRQRISPMGVEAGRNQHQLRPERIAFGTDGTHYITQLKWNRWQSSGAEAVGRYHIDDCVPDCAGGRYHVYRVTMLLSRVLTQHGRSYFAGMTLRWTRFFPPWTASARRFCFSIKRR